MGLRLRLNAVFHERSHFLLIGRERRIESLARFHDAFDMQRERHKRELVGHSSEVTAPGALDIRYFIV